MAYQDVQILKQTGIFAVRYANGNLRIPGFKLLEKCNTTVDMDQDPEVYMMLEPVIITRNPNKAIPNPDMRTSARRVRFIFKAVIMYFKWRLSSGEKMLREKGIDGLSSEVFEDIKAALVRSDGHFSRFSAMAIKRCLQIFTANVMDHARTALPAPKGDTTAKDVAREAWESVREFRAMLTQNKTTLAEPKDSPITGSSTPGPSTPGPAAARPSKIGPPMAGPTTTGSSTAWPSGELSQNAQPSVPQTLQDESSASPNGSGTGGQVAVAGSAASTSAATTRGRGRGRGRGGQRATRGRGGQRAAMGRGGPTALKPLVGKKPRPSRNQGISLDGPSSPARPRASRATAEKLVTRSATSAAPTTTVLGKRRRSEPDPNKEKEAHQAALQKRCDNMLDAMRTASKAMQAFYERMYVRHVAKRDESADQTWVMEATHKELACEVLDLRRRVRTLEKEKEAALSNQGAALSNQGQQPRPGLVTMNMSPRVQQKVNQLFPKTGNGSLRPSKPPVSYHESWSPWGSSRAARNMGLETWLEYIENEATPGDNETVIAPWESTHADEEEAHKSLESASGPRQKKPKTGPHTPPVGSFRHSTSSKSNEMSVTKHLGAETPGEKKWKYKRFDSEAGKWEFIDSDSDDESEVPTESSWASAIPAYLDRSFG